jgi:hypothetical protein
MALSKNKQKKHCHNCKRKHYQLAAKSNEFNWCTKYSNNIHKVIGRCILENGKEVNGN